MGNINIKLNFILKEKSLLPSKVIFSKIYSELDYSTYTITSESETKIIFKYNIWRFGSRSEERKKFDGGRFILTTINNAIEVEFSYYIQLLREIVIIALLIVAGFLKDPLIFIPIIPILILLLIRIDSLKTEAKKLIDRITND